MGHPGKISTAHRRVSRVEETVIGLEELLVALEEIVHLVTDLRYVELAWLVSCRAQKMISFKLFPDAIYFLVLEMS